jgi:hypothetical protein
MTVVASIVVHSPGPNPFPVLAMIREKLGAGNVLEVQRRLQSGPLWYDELESLQAEMVARRLRALGAVVTVEFGPIPDEYVWKPSLSQP